MSDTLFDMTPYKSNSAQSYSPDWRDATGSDSAWDEPDSEHDLETSIHPLAGDAESNSTKAPTMAEEKTTVSIHAKVEVVEELSPEEEADRQRLEVKVERGIEQVEQTFYQMGKALAELRSRRLYRSTHKNFSNYCQERFHPMTRRKAEYLIVASAVMDELKSANNCSHFPLPTAESQIRCLRSLQPEQWQEVWQTGGEHPTLANIQIAERM